MKLWLGSSRGRWEGTTLVVEVTNITDQVRLSVVGDFASDSLKITERWHFSGDGTAVVTATFDDPRVYARPWTVSKKIERVKEPHFEVMEYAGVEGEKDAHLMVDIPKNAAEK